MLLDRTPAYREKFSSISQQSQEAFAAQEEARKTALQELESKHPEVVALFKGGDADWIPEGSYRRLEGSKAPEGCFFLMRHFGNEDRYPHFKLKVIDASVRGIVDELLRLMTTTRSRPAFHTEDDLSNNDD